jgi:hypothetical protein
VAVRFKILGLRKLKTGRLFESDKSLAGNRQGFTREVLAPFVDEFEVLLSSSIQSHLQNGKWAKSTNRRYAYYRSWLQYRYGSDRARKAAPKQARQDTSGNDASYARSYRSAGRRRKGLVRYGQTAEGLAQMPEVLRDPVMFSQFSFIASRLRGERSTFKQIRANEYERRFYIDGGQSADVTEAVKFIDAALERYKLHRDDPAKQRELWQRDANEFARNQEALMAWARTTKPGQRLLRQAQRYALRSGRNRALLGVGDRAAAQARKRGGFELDPEAIGYIKSGQKKLLKRLSLEEAEVKAKRRRNVTGLVGSGFKFGLQTGTLAEAWGRAEFTIAGVAANPGLRAHTTTRYTLSMVPEGGGTPGTPAAAELTRILQANIRRQGGTGELFPRNQLPKMVREALREAAQSPQWRARRVRLRRR